MNPAQVVIVGATGYAGAELVRLLSNHPGVEITHVTSARASGDPLARHCPWLSTQLRLSPFEPNQYAKGTIVFFAQEAGFAMDHAEALIQQGCRVIDLSADFRLNDTSAYQNYYCFEHRAPRPQFKVVYGLTELANHEAIAQAELIANPGCYPTATLLALEPLVRADFVDGTPVIDAKSGTSGAGRSKTATDMLFSERAGSSAVYAPIGHRHIPEIEQMLGLKARFTPHLLPTPRGMEVTIHAPLKLGVTEKDIQSILAETYADSPFVKLVDHSPETKHVIGSNRCDLRAVVDTHTHYVVLSSVIDNLVKGASGQAIQNMNVLLGLPETIGLPVHGVWP